MLRSTIVFQRPPHVRRALQHRSAFVDQVIADMRRPILAPLFPRAFVREFDGLLRDLRFRKTALPRERFDHVAIAIPRREIHVAVNVGRLRCAESARPD